MPVRWFVAMIVGALLGGCGTSRPSAESPPPVVVDVSSAPTGAGWAHRTPAQAYESCRVRVEGDEASGECASDADCASAGCSREMCIPVASAAGVVSTCEILPCFAALASCGCQAGVCSWTLVASMPAPVRVPLPPK